LITGSPGNYPIGNLPVKSAGCGKTSTLKSGLQTITSNGKSRKYYVRIPDGYDNTKPYRLVFGNHWMGGKAEDVDTGQTVTRDVWAYFGLKKLDTEKTTIFVAPDGNQCGTWCKDDEKFINDLITLLKGEFCVDESRVFATGFSFGAIFSYSLACDLPGVFRAVAVLSGANNIGCSNGNTPVAYYGQVGMSDGLCTPALGHTCRDTFVTRNGCTKAASVPEWKSADGKTHICYSYEGCKAGYPVRWCTGNFAHIAAPNDQTTGDNGNTTWSPGEVWKFFTQF
jgi:poly(3-hydroxybutyrate) depolymerase